MVAVIPGTDLADQYVVVGAHYDHLGSSCQYKSSGDTICNGATDNAAGVAAVLAIARSIAGQAVKPRRSVVLALWDSEEDGLRRLAPLRRPPARAAGGHGRLRQLRHPGRQPAPEPAQHQLRGRGRDGRRALRADRALGDRRPDARHGAAQLDLRAEPQRLRVLPQQAGAERLLHRRDRALLPHQRRRGRRGGLRQARAADRHRPARDPRAGQHERRPRSRPARRSSPTRTRWSCSG